MSLRRVGWIIGAGLWLGATGVLTFTSEGQLRGLRAAAAGILGLPALLALGHGFGRSLGRLSPKLRRRIKRYLQSSLVLIHRAGYYPGDITMVSFHVWLVSPIWTTQFLSQRFRHRLVRDKRGKSRWFRPRLHRLAVFRFEHRGQTSITFREGIGIVGRCIAGNNEAAAMTLTLDQGTFATTLSKGREAWDSHTDLEITQQLKFHEATLLSHRYGQVAALPFSNQRGRAIGCITLELPPNAPLRLTDPSAQPLLQTLNNVRDQVADFISGDADED